jgi:hypothetical protein
MNSVLDYDFGPNVNYNQRSGVTDRAANWPDSGELAARTAFG